MKISRRDFLNTAGATGGGGLLALHELDAGVAQANAGAKSRDLSECRIRTTICPYCAVGCGMLVMSQTHNGKRVVVNVEGDPDHPINEGSLCPKGASLCQMANNENRLTKVLYRASGSARFEEKDWKWAAREIALRIKRARDETFAHKNAKGQVVNRTTAIASVGSAALDNEECWLLQKFLRSIGLVYIEHQARI